MLTKLKRATSPFGWLIVKGLVVITPITVLFTILNIFIKNNAVLFWLCTFFWILLFLSVVLIFDNIVEKADNIKKLNDLLNKLKNKGFMCDIEPEPNGVEVFSREDTTFFFGFEDKYYIAGECGCFELDTNEQNVYDVMNRTDEIYCEVLSDTYSKITHCQKNFVKKVQNDIVLLYVNNEYIIQKDKLAFEVWEGDAEDVLDGNKDIDCVFEKYLNERIGNNFHKM